jgi:hypothetical protein
MKAALCEFTGNWRNKNAVMYVGMLTGGSLKRNECHAAEKWEENAAICIGCTHTHTHTHAQAHPQTQVYSYTSYHLSGPHASQMWRNIRCPNFYILWFQSSEIWRCITGFTLPEVPLELPRPFTQITWHHAQLHHCTNLKTLLYFICISK